jgi:MEMO1 family protein
MIKLFFAVIVLVSASPISSQEFKIRLPVDTIGFATRAGQMDLVIKRIKNLQWKKIGASKPVKAKVSKTVICPHDDYTYAGYMYPVALQNVKAKTIIIFGVAHKAGKLGLENKIIFDSYDYWKAPYGNVKVSELRKEIISLLPANCFEVNDTMQKIEHSVEAILPFLQYNQPGLEIISILVPPMNFERMDSVSGQLADVLKKVFDSRKLRWGEDVGFVISNDAVHYGDEDWGGKNFARYGADSTGYEKAVGFERQLISECLEGRLEKPKIKKFAAYTVKKEDFREYQWTWCGRYSVPFGLLVSTHLQGRYSKVPLKGNFLDYSTSLRNPRLPVKDLGMGETAPAGMRHWVGYAAVSFSE